jgi:pentatricopeptide repeat protein
MASFLQNIKKFSKEDLSEPISEYYQSRINILFRKIDINKNELKIYSILKKSQEIVNERAEKCFKGGFFESLHSIYILSVKVKENIANYCLVLSLYFQEKNKDKALHLFLLMCKQNYKPIEYLTNKIFEQIPNMNSANRIAHYYPTITMKMLKIISILIKLSGRFHKCMYEKFYITLYFKIIYALTLVKNFSSNTSEASNQFKFERKYFYSSCLFDLSFYLFNRYIKLSLCTFILRHILDYYGNEINFEPNEIESILLLKVNYNLGLFYYVDGHYKESIFHLNQARERLIEIKLFPSFKKFPNPNDKDDNILLEFGNNSSNNLCNINYFKNFNKSDEFSRNIFKRGSLKMNNISLKDKKKINKETLIPLIKEDNLKTQKEYELKKQIKKKQFSTIYLGAFSLLRFDSPILKEQVKEKLLIEIELLLSEIELNHKNYSESLHHINTVLSMQSNIFINRNNIINEIENDIDKMNGGNYDNIESKIINKSRTLMTKITASSNGKNDTDDKSKIDNKNKIMSNKKKSENISTIILEKIKPKYHLSSNDKNRIMILLEVIENALNDNQGGSLRKTKRLKYNKNFLLRNKYANKGEKIINSKEMEKFFVFICGLSLYQLKILNESQPEPSERRNNLPIIFNNQFQDCLTNAQRMSLALLETMNLTRYILLKDSNKEICFDNLDYRFMKYRIKEEDSDDEHLNKSKSRNYKNDYLKNGRHSSRGSIFSTSTQNNRFSHKLLELKQLYSGREEERPIIELIMNKIKSEYNKDFIDIHKKSIIKLLTQLDKEQLNFFAKCPKLLKKMINNVSKIYTIKDNEETND